MSSGLMQRLLQNQRIFILLFVVLGITWFLNVRDVSYKNKADLLEHDHLVVDPACDVTKAFCNALLGDASLQLRVGPGVSALKPFPIEVKLAGMKHETIRHVIVEYSMKGMDMGPNRSVLTLRADGNWQGSGILPICTSGRSDWMAEVQVVGDKRLLTAQFSFSLKGLAAQ